MIYFCQLTSSVVKKYVTYKTNILNFFEGFTGATVKDIHL